MQLDLWSRSHNGQPRIQSLQSTAPRLVVVPRVVPSPLDEHRLDDVAKQYLQAAHAERTRIAYDMDWRTFEHWCDVNAARSLPASTTTLTRYLTHLAETGRKASTIRRARIAIGVMHGARGLPRPDQDPRIRTLERGIGRTHGTREEGAAPLLLEQLEQLIGTLGHSIRDDRDRAMLLLGFAGAFRSSELVSLQIEDVTVHVDRLVVRLARAKEDQLGRGRVTEIPRAHNPALCALAAVTRWIERVGCAKGALFRRVTGVRISSDGLAPRAVTRAVQRAAAQSGIDGEYSSHSLRSGLATSAFAHGASDRDIQAHGRWKDRRSLDRYIQVAVIPNRKNVVEGWL